MKAICVCKLIHETAIKKHNHGIYLPVHGCQNKCLTVCTSLALCAFRLSVWKWFVAIHASWYLLVFWLKQVFRCCVNFSTIWWLLFSKERVQWALHLFPFWHTLAHVLILQGKLDTDLRNKSCHLYPTVQFISRRARLYSARECLARFTFLFFNVCLWQFLICFKAFITFWYNTKKIITTCISQRVITLLVQGTSGEENYLFLEFFTRFGWVDNR